MEKKNNNYSNLGRIIGYVFKNYPIQLIILVVGIIINSLAVVQGTTFMRTLIDGYIIPLMNQESPNFTSLLYAILRVAGFYAIGVTGYYVAVRMMIYVAQGTIRKIRYETFSYMEKLPIRYFDTHSHGDIMSVYTNDIDTLRDFILNSMGQLTESIATIISITVAMLMLSPIMTLVAFLLIGIMLYISSKVAKLSGKNFVNQQVGMGKLNGYVEEMISGQKVIKVFCHEEEATKKFEQYNDELRNSSYKANSLANILMPVIFQIANINYVICAVVGSMFALNNLFGLTIGGVVAFLALIKSFNQPFSQISQQMNAVAKAAAGATRIYKLWGEKVEEDEGNIKLVNVEEKNSDIVEVEKNTGKWAWKSTKTNGDATYTKLEGKIVMKDVDFGYNEEKAVLHDINLYAYKGQKVAFVGSTGAGKTTITNLINRFYDIQKGVISYDGIDIKDIKKADLRKSLGIVLQETNLFTDTVMENIRYGRADATDEECKQAAKLANAAGFIERLPQGYDTIIRGEGGRLSQGQRQLIAIARAAVADPPVLILDEATSSIDTRTERLVQKGMDALMSGRTTFVIAHRLSTVKNADCIMVLENGRIIERGSHDELLEQKGRYYKLYTGD